MRRYKYIYKYIAAVLAASTLSILFTACGNAKTADTREVEAKTIDNVNDTVAVSDVFSKRDLSGEYDIAACKSIVLSDAGSTTDADGVTIDGSTITIAKEGEYILSGSLSDGMIIIDADKAEKVQLILNGVEIKSATSAAVYVKQADKVFVTLADGTKNTLSNGGAFVAIDENNIDAVIFSKEDLTLNGTGSLTITSPAGHGIVSKDDLVVANGNYQITAASHGLAGKDSVAVADGVFEITAGKDALHSANDDDDTKGWVYIENGTFQCSVESDGISAVNEIRIAGGKIVIEKSYEGIEARLINISGGEIEITSSDDGLNATDKRNASTGNTKENTNQVQADAGNDAGKNFGKGGFGGMMDTQEEASINISGGIIRINAEGDGVDSNGYLAMSGGELYVAGPSNSGNGALDYGISASISGGIVVAAGVSGMAQNFGENSTQCAMLVNSSSQQAAGTEISVLDSAGKELVAWTAEKSYNSVVISSPELAVGSTYTVKMGDNTTEVTFENTIYGEGNGFGGGMHGGFKRGDKRKGNFPTEEGGQLPEGKPDFENGERPEGMLDFENGENQEDI